MTQTYINTNILLACLSTLKSARKDIHTEGKETRTEHKRITQELENILSNEHECHFLTQEKPAA
jgi:hypothetical protein